MSRSQGTIIPSSRLKDLLSTSAMDRLKTEFAKQQSRDLPPGKWSAIISPTREHDHEPLVLAIFNQNTMLMNGLGRWSGHVDQYEFLTGHPRVLDAKRRAKEAGLDFIEVDLTIAG